MQRIFGRLVCVLGLAMATVSCGDDGVNHLADAPDGIDTPPAMAMLTIDRATASFGSVTLSTVSPATTFTITNSGGAATGALATSLGGTDAASFAVGANTCTGDVHRDGDVLADGGRREDRDLDRDRHARWHGDRRTRW